jgi:hypothetical protein
MKKFERAEKKEKKKDVKKRLQSGEWTQPDPTKKTDIPKIERFNWADEV